MTPEQWLRRLQAEGGALEAQSLRLILRTFTAIDDGPLIAALAQALLSPNPAQRLQAREYLQSLASSLYPALPADLLTLTRSGVSLGAEAGAGMLTAEAGAFVPAVVAEVASETEMRLRALWGDARAEHSSRVGKIITRALSAGGRYPVRQELERALKVGRVQAQTIALTETSRTLNEAQARTTERAIDQLDLSVVKVWRAASDARTRPSHSRVNGEERPWAKAFSNGLQRPHAPGAPAKEVVRCRCVMLTRVKD